MTMTDCAAYSLPCRDKGAEPLQIPRRDRGRGAVVTTGYVVVTLVIENAIDIDFDTATPFVSLARPDHGSRVSGQGLGIAR
jgi:hypothetical protein